MSQTLDDFDIVDRPGDGTVNNEPPGNPAPHRTEGTPLVRRGKPHGNACILQMLRALPKAAVIEQNLLINARNRKHARTHAYNNLTKAVSSDESLITIPEEEPTTAPSQQSLTQQVSTYIASLSPDSAKKWLKNIPRKRMMSHHSV
ncbi:hypothetical protein M378DRAFT_13946 [Amanita muscaria Koide BX008]|uniref:Uncharacterized protein n=1 Tax=Amanita muscaria (strain Koide BX008) TaxID=946122 RepID=A0A0C2WWG3_AMAMK|nr:hypothetical protein M378DRAFT_13946 [Amanita muscaria Koide BX008]